MGIGHASSNYCFYFLLACPPLYLVQQRGLSIAEMTLLATLGYAVQGGCVAGHRPLLGLLDSVRPLGSLDPPTV